ncbi:MAG: hypothetical protein ABS79_00675 [Planctomycetes bacterium SCN 63-9]|nr:MAG: hypothetical protein ABS79_00675 [Planctomycetes bacterium SCN 63-9]
MCTIKPRKQLEAIPPGPQTGGVGRADDQFIAVKSLVHTPTLNLRDHIAETVRVPISRNCSG